jgi:hypothetical protein
MKLTQSRRNLLGQMKNRGYAACGPSAGGSPTLADELVRSGLASFSSEFSGTRYYKITDAGRAALRTDKQP